MKLVGIGDLFIPGDYIKAGFEGFGGMDISVIDWEIASLDEVQRINLLLEQNGSEAYLPDEKIMKFVEDADIIITQFCPVGRAMIERCKNLKVIGVLRAGTENVNLEYASKKGIVVYNTPGRNADAVADFTVGGMICEFRNIARSHMVMKQGGWKSDYPNIDYVPDLPGKTVGLVGLGEIGLKVAQRLFGFEVKLLACDPYFEGEAPYGIELVSLEELVERSDFISLHTRLTQSTRHMINAQLLKGVKKGAYFINTARSGLVDEVALHEALSDGRLAGAFLDVFEQEPTTADYPLVALENVTVAPHMAGGSSDAFLGSPRKLAAMMTGLLQGECGRSVLNAEQFEDCAKKFLRV